MEGLDSKEYGRKAGVEGLRNEDGGILGVDMGTFVEAGTYNRGMTEQEDKIKVEDFYVNN